MSFPPEIFGLISSHLYGRPRDLLHLVLTCKAAHNGIRDIYNPMIAKISVVSYDKNVKNRIPVSGTYDLPSRLLDNSGNKYCDVEVGNVSIRIRRYSKFCLVRMFEDDIMYHEYMIYPGSSKGIATTQFLDKVIPFVIPGWMKLPPWNHISNIGERQKRMVY